MFTIWINFPAIVSVNIKILNDSKIILLCFHLHMCEHETQKQILEKEKKDLKTQFDPFRIYLEYY